MMHNKYYRSELILKSIINATIFWTVMSGEYKVLFASIGVITVIITTIVSTKVHIFAYNEMLSLRAVIYIYRIIQDIIQSSVYLTKVIYQDSAQFLNSGVIQLNIESLNKQQKIMLSNAITMTPGTFVITLNNNTLLIHTINKNKSLNLNKEFSGLIEKIKT
ncbi:MAG: hypothetical protein RL208_777 [Pseudomonadota bacterium]|jgi:multisubunit Na+/H+ antiporter MnhE subunit